MLEASQAVNSTVARLHAEVGELALSLPSAAWALDERATAASRGRLKLIPKAIVGFPAEVRESE